MHRRSTDERLVRQRQLDGREDERTGLEAAHAAVERDQLLERAALVELGVVEAVHEEIGRVREPVRAKQVLRGRRGERRERILPLDAPVGEEPRAATAEHDRPGLRGADEHEADVLVLEQGRDQLRVPLVDLLAGQAPRLVQQVHEAEIPGAEHDDVLAAHVLLAAALLARLVALPGRLVEGDADAGAALVLPRLRAHVVRLDRAANEILERVAVPLLERGALRLAVIGEDDDVVRPRRVLPRPLEAPELLVELPERLERVGPLEPGVMGDLVVAREGGVDRRPADEHVREHGVDDEVAQADAHSGAQERVDPTAVPTGTHVSPALARGRDDLQDHLPDDQDDRSRHVEAVGEERAVARVGLLLLADPARGEDDVVRLARQQVAPARAAVPQEAVAGVAPLELRAVVGVRADHQLHPLLLDPAEGGDVLVRAEQDAGLARAGLRGEVGLPLDEAVRRRREPARHVRRVSVAHRALQDGLREPVDLEVEDPRHLGLLSIGRLAGDAVHDAERVGVVVVRAEDHLQDGRQGGDHERAEERPAEAVDLEAAVDASDEEKRERIGGEHEEEGERDRVGQPERGDHRRDDRVHDRDQQRDAERAPETLDVETRQNRGCEQDRDRAHEPGEEHARRPELGTDVRALRPVAVLGCRRGGHARDSNAGDAAWLPAPGPITRVNLARRATKGVETPSGKAHMLASAMGETAACSAAPGADQLEEARAHGGRRRRARRRAEPARLGRSRVVRASSGTR